MSTVAEEFLTLVKKKETKKVIELINREPDIFDYVYRNRNTPFAYICMYMPHLIYFCVEKGANVNERIGDIGCSLLSALCIYKRYNNGSAMLIRYGANVNMKEISEGKTALMTCSSEDNIFILKLLVDYGARIEDKDRNGDTALMYMCAHEAKKCIDFLIKSGANVNNKNISGETPLFKSVRRGYGLTVKKLLEEGADIFIKNNKGETVLSLDTNPYIKDLLKKYLDEVKSLISKKFNSANVPTYVINDHIMKFVEGFGSKRSKRSKRNKRRTSRTSRK